MKKKYFSILALMPLFFSCSSDDDFMDVPEKQSDLSIKSVVVTDGVISDIGTRSLDTRENLTLWFDSDATLQEFKEQLKTMSDADKMNVVKEYGIINLHDIADKADDELEEIGKNASSEEDFRKLYKEYVDKYKGLLITNNIDTEDLTLYVPDADNIETFICNKQGEYVVGNEVRKIEFDNELSESTRKASAALMASGTIPPSSGVNSIMYKPRSNLRIYFDAHMVNIRLWVKMHAQKKMWYGWKNDPNRKYYFESYISVNFAYLMEGPYGQEVVANRLPRYVCDQNVKNGFNFILGKISGGNRLTGYFLVWSDSDSEFGSDGKQLTEVKDGIVMPLCLPEKAHVVTLDVTLQN